MVHKIEASGTADAFYCAVWDDLLCMDATEENPEEHDEYVEAADLEEYLKMKEGKQLWANEDISLRKVELVSSKELIRLAEKAVRAFMQSKSSLADEWATEALTWAISCPSFHLVNRSYQMYRYVSACSILSPHHGLPLIGLINQGSVAVR